MANQNPSPATRFKTDRDEPLKAKLSMRITQSMLDELKKQENWQELVRNAIAEKLAQKKNQDQLKAS
ncbi:MAG: hypothetical protein QNJ38_04725 [Prochloraceae cyanobacterium]|nr:hypothetical protein [Prochloraceae cyanobacterium]